MWICAACFCEGMCLHRLIHEASKEGRGNKRDEIMERHSDHPNVVCLCIRICICIGPSETVSNYYNSQPFCNSVGMGDETQLSIVSIDHRYKKVDCQGGLCFVYRRGSYFCLFLNALTISYYCGNNDSCSQEKIQKSWIVSLMQCDSSMSLSPQVVVLFLSWAGCLVQEKRGLLGHWFIEFLKM